MISLMLWLCQETSLGSIFVLLKEKLEEALSLRQKDN